MPPFLTCPIITCCCCDIPAGDKAGLRADATHNARPTERTATRPSAGDARLQVMNSTNETFCQCQVGRRGPPAPLLEEQVNGFFCALPLLLPAPTLCSRRQRVGEGRRREEGGQRSENGPEAGAAEEEGALNAVSFFRPTRKC